MRFDVVIAGAGIGGAVLALALGRRGWRIAIVERESAPPLIARPEILWGATPRALDGLGIGNAIRSASVKVDAIDIGGEEPWLRITGNDFAAADVEAFSTNPSLTRSMVAGAAVATGNVEIHHGITVEDLLCDAGRVTGVRGKRGDPPLELHASLVVGDDGGSSTVRARLGIPIALEAFPIEFVTAHIRQWPLPAHRGRVWIDRKGLQDGLPAAGFIPWPENEGVLLVPLPADRAQSLFVQSSDAFWRALARVTPLAAAVREQLEFPRDFRRVARPFGHAQSYVANGAALMGDAAHPMTPAGGQGANASIWDALALAEIADAALRASDVSRERLLSYERLRRPANERSMSFSRGARQAFRFTGMLPLALVLPGVAKTLDTLGWPKRKVIRTFANAFVHPRTSD
ncbi:MAG TPA: NAD(P)/FAD-dependent oxidoreductase [Thermoanaerobaculia bacterium]|nr:NAD(P)/FAD-dependent oxidoreductase [Thermoanaerobaculia bacterium]